MSTELVQLRSFYAEPGFVLVARNAGRVTGCVALRPIITATATAEIRRLFVDPPARGQGTARTLLAHLLAHARHRGVERLVLNTLPSMGPAIGLYQELGFTPIEPYVHDPAEGVLWFGCELPEAAELPEIPPGYTLVRTTPTFTSDTVPTGLLNAHRVADGVWGRIRVQAGTVVFVFDDDAQRPVVLAAGDHLDIPPQRRHHVEPDVDAIFEVEFHQRLHDDAAGIR